MDANVKPLPSGLDTIETFTAIRKAKAIAAEYGFYGSVSDKAADSRIGTLEQQHVINGLFSKIVREIGRDKRQLAVRLARRLVLNDEVK